MPPPDPVIVRVPAEIAEYVPEYLEITRAELAQAAAALEDADYRTIKTLGHNLKGSGTSFGIGELSRIGSEIEAAALANTRESIAPLLEELRCYLDALMVIPE